MKKKLGVFIPTRPELRKVDFEKPGIFLESVGNPILNELKKEFDLVEGLDFRKAAIINGKVFFDDYDSSELDGYFWFSMMDKDSDGHDLLILEQLEKTMPVINPSKGLKVGLDKFKTSSYLNSCGIQTPEFAFIRSNDEKTIKKIFDSWKGSVLAKPRWGGFGIGIFKADNPNQLIDLLDFSSLPHVYIERFYENDMNDWCGVNVVGNKVLYGYGKKSSKITDYKVFDRDQIGGEMIFREPNKEQTRIALDVANKTGMDFFGIDIIKSDGKYYVIDMNTFPGIYPEMVNPKLIAEEFLRMVKGRMNI